MPEHINIITKWFRSKFPQNYIIRNSFTGALIIALFCYGFLTLYKPLNAHASKSLSYEATMAIYSLLSGASVIVFALIIKIIPYFSHRSEWIILKELLSVIIIITGIGITIYFAGFLIEPSSPRWNMPTFLNSLKSAFLLAIIPFLFFTAINYSFLFLKSHELSESSGTDYHRKNLPEEKQVQISSQLKKEVLSFYPSELEFVESDGNYVVFYLKRNSQIKKEIIRNSISNIEQQLSEFPQFMRTHRAYIVNLAKVKNKQGNTLGYQLRLKESDFIIPVSRTNIRDFDTRFAGFHT